MAEATIGGFRRVVRPDGEPGPLVVDSLAGGGTEGGATEITVANRYGGGKQALAATVTATGETTVHTPAAGKKMRLFWVSAINDPDQSQSPLIQIKLGATELYRAYAVAHWEVFDGAVDAPLTVTLDQSGSVAVTAHYQEVT